MREIRTLTGLRGYAALWVCLFHFTLPWAGYDNPLMPIARYGNYGVSIFFVLSGFILAHVYQDWFRERVSREHYAEFLWRRFARIYPLHALTLVLTGLLMWSGLMTFGPFDNVTTFFLNVFLLQGWGYPDAVTWNTPAWTISVELFSYLLFPFVMALMCRAHTAVLIIAGVTTYFGIFAYLNLLECSGVDILHKQFAYGIYLVRYFLMFVVGMVTFHFADRIGPSIKSNLAFDAIATFGLMVIIWRCIYNGHPHEIIYGSALLVFGLSRDRGIGRAVMGNPVAVALGDWSYALYLSHIIVLSVVWDVASRMGYAFPALPLWLTISIAVAVAAFLHATFERPTRRALRGMLRPNAPSRQEGFP